MKNFKKESSFFDKMSFVLKNTFIIVTIICIAKIADGRIPTQWRYNGIINTVTCWWQPSPANPKQSQFSLSLSANGQEMENIYINNTAIYLRTIEYLNGDIAHDVYLHLNGRGDSLMANSATYLRQYGTTGHSTVLLTFPVADKRLIRGCYLTFRSAQLGISARHFIFNARDFKHNRRASAIQY